MRNLIITIIVSALASFLSLVVYYNFVPLSVLEVTAPKEARLGSSITTLNGSDRLTDSRAVINTNFSNLNSGKFELSDWYATTSAQQITTLAGLTTANSLTSASALATIGTITSGIWNGTIVTPTYGGTGWGSLQANTVLLGNGTTKIATTSSGTNGQVLTLSGGVPTWSSGTVDQTIDYNWTGSAFRVKNLHASSTAANPLVLNGVSYTFPSSAGTASTTLTNGGSGNLVNIFASQKIVVNTSPGDVVSTTASTTIFSITVPANMLSTNNSIVIDIPISNFQLTNTNAMHFETAYGTATSSSRLSPPATTAALRGTIRIYLSGAGTTGSQKLTSSAFFVENGVFTANADTDTAQFLVTDSLSVDSTVNQTLMLVARPTNSGVQDTITAQQVIASLIAN